jgi:class 3 adenylate cyclase/tetratricopeptide (TPR) repeat protein
MRQGDGGLLHYLARAHASWLATASDAVEHRCVDATLVFADVSGFTPLSERLARQGKVGAEYLTDILNDLFTRLLDTAAAHGGDLLKFGGDANFLLFTGRDHAAHAAAAAMAMQRELRAFRGLRHRAGRVSLRMSVGIASGPVDLVLTTGSHRELFVLGPTVSGTLAAESAADAGEVLLDAATASALDPSLLGDAKPPGVLLRAAPDVTLTAAQPEPQVSDAARGLPVALLETLRDASPYGEHRVSTLAFLQFTNVDERLRAGDRDGVAADLDELMHVALDAAAQHDVTFLATDVAPDGGKLLFAAGVPRSAGDDEDRMLHAARAIVDAHPKLPLRIGVNHGRAFAVDVGSPRRRTFAVMGDATNLAARVMGKAGYGTVLATRAVVDRCRGDYDLTFVEPFTVKGKSMPIEAAFVDGLHRARRRAEKIAAPADTVPLVGRDDELQVLRDAIAAARDGRGRVVELVGDAGIGKTRLIQATFGATDLPKLTITANPFAMSVPYEALSTPLRDLVGAPDDDDKATTILRRTIERVAPDLEPLLPLAAVAFGLVLPDTDVTSRIDEAYRRDRIHAVVADLLDHLLPGPATITVEDAHWLDDATREFLAFHLASISSRALAVCVTRRPGDGAFDVEPGRDDWTTLALEPLAGDAARALLELATDHAPLPPHEVAALVERSAGNPLFLQELASAARTGRQAADLPDSVEALIATRIDAVARDDRARLQVASVLGPVFDAGLFAQLAGVDTGVLLAPTRLGRFLVADGPGTLRFHHALVQEVAYEGLAYRRRHELHARAAQLIEEREMRPEDWAETLSTHYPLAERWERAWHYSRVAAERARHNAATVEAVRFLQRAWHAGRRVDGVDAATLVDVLEQLGDVAVLGGQYDTARGAYDDARRLVPDQPLRIARLFRKHGTLRERAGNLTDALRWFTRGDRLLDDVPRSREAIEARADLLTHLGAARLQQGRPRHAVPVLEEAAALAARVGGMSTLAHAYFLLDWALTDLDDPAAARYRLLALPMYEALGDFLGQANVLNNFGVNAYFEGRWAEALDYYERFRVACERAGDMVQQATAVNNIGEIRCDQGHLDEAADDFHQASSLWRAFKFPIGIALAESNLGRVATRTGRFDEAEVRYAEARERFGAISAERYVLETDAREAERRVAAFDADGATALVDSACAQLARLGGGTVLLAMLERIAGVASAQRGDLEGARAHFVDSLDRARAVNADFEAALTLDALAVVAHHMGDDAASVAAADEAGAIFERLGVVAVPVVPF